jgi:hypothetical protein
MLESDKRYKEAEDLVVKAAIRYRALARVLEKVPYDKCDRVKLEARVAEQFTVLNGAIDSLLDFRAHATVWPKEPPLKAGVTHPPH